MRTDSDLEPKMINYTSKVTRSGIQRDEEPREKPQCPRKAPDGDDGVRNTLQTYPDGTYCRTVGHRAHVLYEPPSGVEPTLDIVFVHGLNSGELTCWAAVKGKTQKAVEEKGEGREKGKGQEERNESDFDAAVNSLYDSKGTAKKNKNESGPATPLSRGPPTSASDLPEGALWPGAFLPQDFPLCRVLTVGYQSGMIKSGEGADLNLLDALLGIAPSATKTTSATSSSSSSSSKKLISCEENESSPKKKKEAEESIKIKEREEKERKATVAAFTIDDCARTLRDTLLSPEINIGGVLTAPSSASAFAPQHSRARRRPVVFVMHSLGGLIVKQMLLNLYIGEAETAEGLAKDAALLGCVKGLVFYSTPHFGASIARYLHYADGPLLSTVQSIASLLFSAVQLVSFSSSLSSSSSSSSLSKKHEEIDGNVSDRNNNSIRDIADGGKMGGEEVNANEAEVGANPSSSTASREAKVATLIKTLSDGNLLHLHRLNKHFLRVVTDLEIPVLNFGEGEREKGVMMIVKEESSDPLFFYREKDDTSSSLTSSVPTNSSVGHPSTSSFSLFTSAALSLAWPSSSSSNTNVAAQQVLSSPSHTCRNRYVQPEGEEKINFDLFDYETVRDRPHTSVNIPSGKQHVVYAKLKEFISDRVGYDSTATKDLSTLYPLTHTSSASSTILTSRTTCTHTSTARRRLLHATTLDTKGDSKRQSEEEEEEQRRQQKREVKRAAAEAVEVDIRKIWGDIISLLVSTPSTTASAAHPLSNRRSNGDATNGINNASSSDSKRLHHHHRHHVSVAEHSRAVVPPAVFAALEVAEELLTISPGRSKRIGDLLIVRFWIRELFHAVNAVLKPPPIEPPRPTTFIPSSYTSSVEALPEEPYVHSSSDRSSSLPLSLPSATQFARSVSPFELQRVHELHASLVQCRQILERVENPPLNVTHDAHTAFLFASLVTLHEAMWSYRRGLRCLSPLSTLSAMDCWSDAFPPPDSDSSDNHNNEGDKKSRSDSLSLSLAISPPLIPCDLGINEVVASLAAVALATDAFFPAALREEWVRSARVTGVYSSGTHGGKSTSVGSLLFMNDAKGITLFSDGYCGGAVVGGTQDRIRNSTDSCSSSLGRSVSSVGRQNSESPSSHSPSPLQSSLIQPKLVGTRDVVSGFLSAMEWDEIPAPAPLLGAVVAIAVHHQQQQQHNESADDRSLPPESSVKKKDAYRSNDDHLSSKKDDNNINNENKSCSSSTVSGSNILIKATAVVTDVVRWTFGGLGGAGGGGSTNGTGAVETKAKKTIAINEEKTKELTSKKGNEKENEDHRQQQQQPPREDAENEAHHQSTRPDGDSDFSRQRLMRWLVAASRLGERGLIKGESKKGNDISSTNQLLFLEEEQRAAQLNAHQLITSLVHWMSASAFSELMLENNIKKDDIAASAATTGKEPANPSIDEGVCQQSPPPHHQMPSVDLKRCENNVGLGTTTGTRAPQDFAPSTSSDANASPDASISISHTPAFLLVEEDESSYPRPVERRSKSDSGALHTTLQTTHRSFHHPLAALGDEALWLMELSVSVLSCRTMCPSLSVSHAENMFGARTIYGRFSSDADNVDINEEMHGGREPPSCELLRAFLLQQTAAHEHSLCLSSRAHMKAAIRRERTAFTAITRRGTISENMASALVRSRQKKAQNIVTSATTTATSGSSSGGRASSESSIGGSDELFAKEHELRFVNFVLKHPNLRTLWSDVHMMGFVFDVEVSIVLGTLERLAKQLGISAMSVKSPSLLSGPFALAMSFDKELYEQSSIPNGKGGASSSPVTAGLRQDPVRGAAAIMSNRNSSAETKSEEEKQRARVEKMISLLESDRNAQLSIAGSSTASSSVSSSWTQWLTSVLSVGGSSGGGTSSSKSKSGTVMSILREEISLHAAEVGEAMYEPALMGTYTAYSLSLLRLPPRVHKTSATAPVILEGEAVARVQVPVHEEVFIYCKKLLGTATAVVAAAPPYLVSTPPKGKYSEEVGTPSEPYAAALSRAVVDAGYIDPSHPDLAALAGRRAFLAASSNPFSAPATTSCAPLLSHATHHGTNSAPLPPRHPLPCRGSSIYYHDGRGRRGSNLENLSLSFGVGAHRTHFDSPYPHPHHGHLSAGTYSSFSLMPSESARNTSSSAYYHCSFTKAIDAFKRQLSNSEMSRPHSRPDPYLNPALASDARVALAWSYLCRASTRRRDRGLLQVVEANIREGYRKLAELKELKRRALTAEHTAEDGRERDEMGNAKVSLAGDTCVQVDQNKRENDPQVIADTLKSDTGMSSVTRFVGQGFAGIVSYFLRGGAIEWMYHQQTLLPKVSTETKKKLLSPPLITNAKSGEIAKTKSMGSEDDLDSVRGGVKRKEDDNQGEGKSSSRRSRISLSRGLLNSLDEIDWRDALMVTTRHDIALSLAIQMLTSIDNEGDELGDCNRSETQRPPLHSYCIAVKVRALESLLGELETIAADGAAAALAMGNINYFSTPSTITDGRHASVDVSTAVDLDDGLLALSFDDCSSTPESLDAVDVSAAKSIFEAVLAEDPTNVWAMCGRGRCKTLHLYAASSKKRRGKLGRATKTTTTEAAAAVVKTFETIQSFNSNVHKGDSIESESDGLRVILLRSALKDFKAALDLSGGQCQLAAHYLGELGGDVDLMATFCDTLNGKTKIKKNSETQSPFIVGDQRTSRSLSIPTIQRQEQIKTPEQWARVCGKSKRDMVMISGVVPYFDDPRLFSQRIDAKADTHDKHPECISDRNRADGLGRFDVSHYSYAYNAFGGAPAPFSWCAPLSTWEQTFYSLSGSDMSTISAASKITARRGREYMYVGANDGFGSGFGEEGTNVVEGKKHACGGWYDSFWEKWAEKDSVLVDGIYSSLGSSGGSNDHNERGHGGPQGLPFGPFFETVRGALLQKTKNSKNTEFDTNYENINNNNMVCSFAEGKDHLSSFVLTNEECDNAAEMMLSSLRYAVSSEPRNVWAVANLFVWERRLGERREWWPRHDHLGGRGALASTKNEAFSSVRPSHNAVGIASPSSCLAAGNLSQRSSASQKFGLGRQLLNALHLALRKH